MRKIQVLLAALAAVALLAAPAFAASTLKIGVVDLQTALNQTQDGIKAKESLKQKHQARQDQIDARQKELKELADKIKSPVVAKDAKATMQRDFEKKQAELRVFVTQAMAEEEADNKKASEPILKGLVKVAEKLAQDQGVTLLLEKSAGGVLMAEEPVVDLTPQVVKSYNANPPAVEKKVP